jgi:hypothetical protein
MEEICIFGSYIQKIAVYTALPTDEDVPFMPIITKA